MNLVISIIIMKQHSYKWIFRWSDDHISTTVRDDDNKKNNNYNIHNILLLLLSSPLEISPEHLIMLDRDNKRYLIRASDIRVGDIISGKIVTHIDTVIRVGVYSPLKQ
jgi:hypothetical protein